MGEAKTEPKQEILPETLDLLCCPRSHSGLSRHNNRLVSEDGTEFRISAEGIPLFAEELHSQDAAFQQEHYDKISTAYVSNLSYIHTREYTAYLDHALLSVINADKLYTVAEICCGRGEALHLLKQRVRRGIGVDLSLNMLREAFRIHADHSGLCFVQGDATRLPLPSDAFDSVLMLGGIHHINDRSGLFAEVSRILKPGGHFYFREPANDFWLWRALRAPIYRFSPMLDHETERPLRVAETIRQLADAGLELESWSTHGFLGFCLFMNSDVLVFNRAFRFIPGIRRVTRTFANLDEWLLSHNWLRYAGLQVVGVAIKP